MPYWNRNISSKDQRIRVGTRGREGCAQVFVTDHYLKHLGLNFLGPSKLVHVLAFGTPKFYIAPYDKIKHELVNLSSNCDVKSGLNLGRVGIRVT